MTEQEAKDLFGPFEEDEKVTPEMKSAAQKTMENITRVAKMAHKDMVNHPAHYNAGDIECIDAIKSCVQGLSGYEGFCIGNAIKYIWRWKKKGGLTDLNKAEWYVDRILNEGSDAK